MSLLSRLPCFDKTIRNCHGQVSSNHVPFITLPLVYNAFASSNLFRLKIESCHITP